MSDMFFAVITGIIAVILFIYVFFAARCKGPILSNTYLFASEKAVSYTHLMNRQSTGEFSLHKGPDLPAVNFLSGVFRHFIPDLF